MDIIAVIPVYKGSQRFPFKSRAKIGDKTPVELTIECALQIGIKKIYVSIKHLGEQLKSFLGNGLQFSEKVECFEEEKPKYHSIINAGIYSLSVPIIDLLEENSYCNMPSLFMRALVMVSLQKYTRFIKRGLMWLIEDLGKVENFKPLTTWI